MSKKSTFIGNKSPYNYEIMHSGDEIIYAEELETDDSVLAWTKKHGIAIKYRNKKGGNLNLGLNISLSNAKLTVI